MLLYRNWYLIVSKLVPKSLNSYILLIASKKKVPGVITISNCEPNLKTGSRRYIFPHSTIYKIDQADQIKRKVLSNCKEHMVDESKKLNLAAKLDAYDNMKSTFIKKNTIV
ncbi:hypothetical protein CDAR_491521 [Caerostris darwini]|uniref:Uncharacterized protein n=1 Tax=Caerostris darwini TaxID=1538125 RepID=A0AAV4X724_9ARAC|nr:hypothetical protein CDAR_491521 [Caerostris darwini]